MKKDFIAISDYSSEEIVGLLDLADKIKKNADDYRESLKGKNARDYF